MPPKPRDMYKIALRIAESKLRQAEDALKFAKKHTPTEVDAAERALEEARKQFNDLKKGTGSDRQAAVDAVMQDAYEQFGEYIEELINRVPELAGILAEAVEKGWDADKFLNEFYKTEWWENQEAKGRERSWFEAFVQEYGGPSEGPDWNSSIANAKSVLEKEFARYGVDFNQLTADQQYSLARSYMYENWKEDTDELQAAVSRTIRNRVTDGNPRPGDIELDLDSRSELSDYIRTLEETALEYGLDVSGPSGQAFIRNQAMQLMQTAKARPLTVSDVTDIFVRRATRKFGLEEGDIGFMTGVSGAEGAQRTLKQAVYDAISSGGAAARRLLENPAIRDLLKTWKDDRGVTYEELLRNAVEDGVGGVLTAASAVGLQLSRAEAEYWAREVKYNGWTSDQLERALYERRQSGVSPITEPEPVPGEGDGAAPAPAPSPSPGSGSDDGGTYQTTRRQLVALLESYGIYDADSAWIDEMVDSAINPDKTAGAGKTWEQITNIVIDLAKQRYPNYSDKLSAGQTMRQASANYVWRMANLLELESETIKLNDPLLESVLTSASPDGPMSLADFSKAVRSDKRWQFTGNARDTYMDAVQGFLSRMGFTG